MDRRTFMSWVGIGFLASSLPVAIAACSPETTEPTTDTAAPPPPPREDGFTTVGTVADLDANGSITDKAFTAGPLLVIRSPEDSSTLIALDATCTHQGCTAEWKSDDAILACPCHGSKYNPDGSVANGPAEKSLAVFEVKTEGDSVLVKAT